MKASTVWGSGCAASEGSTVWGCRSTLSNSIRQRWALAPLTWQRALAMLAMALLVLQPGAGYAHSGNAGQSGPAPQASPVAKIARDLQEVDPSATVDVIVQYARQPQGSHSDKIRGLGGHEKAQLENIRGTLVSLPARALQALADSDDVLYISPDREVKASLSTAAPATNAPLVWKSGWTGTGIGVAVIDSGVKVEADFGHATNRKLTRVVYEQSFWKQDPQDTSTVDKFGHGTHVAGIIAGNGKNSNGRYRGIAYNANIISFRVLDLHGSSTDSRVIQAINRAIQLKGTYNIRVMNLSLGRQVYESYTLDPLCQAVKAAWDAGIVVVVAAGNEGRNDSAGTSGYGTIGSPGNSPHVITVGAMRGMDTTSRVDDLVASYSAKGPTPIDRVVKPDIVAPGNGIVAVGGGGTRLVISYPENLVPSNVAEKYYFRMSGTSMATGAVSGAVALMLQKTPSLTPDQVKARLMKTASKAFPQSSSATDPTTGVTYTSQYDIFTIGAGYLDVYAALASNEVATGTALSPTARFDAATGNVYLVHANGVVWGSGVLWGTGVVWGTGVIWGNSIVWGANNTEVNGTGVLWGTGVVWGNSTTSGFGVVWGNGVIWGAADQACAETDRLALNGDL